MLCDNLNTWARSHKITEIDVRYIHLKKTNNTMHQTTDDKWRNQFHIQPPKGLLNDPNGLIYHDGLYHVFYQWHPDAPTHGLKYWNHVTSKDLVHWKQDSRILKPDTIYDSHGAYSGSALVVDDNIELFYTGNTRTSDNLRIPYQLKATLADEAIVNKTVVIDHIPQGYTDHFRDPKVFTTPKGYAMILGAQRSNKTGTTLLYTSTDLKSWSIAKELTTSLDTFGFMWECPDYFELDHRGILLFCPQGAMNTPQTNTNIYPNAYIVGDYDDINFDMSHHTAPRLLDYGFDFYAAQTFLDREGNRTLIAWIGAAEGGYPSDTYGWAHVLTVPRVLSLVNDHLYQKPHPNLISLRKDSVSIDANLKTYELVVDDIDGSLDIDLYRYEDECINIQYDPTRQIMDLDRKTIENSYAHDRGQTRMLKMDEPLKDIQVFRDTSTLEIFINQGRYTMTLRFFPKVIPGCVKIKTLNDTAIVSRYSLEDVNHDL